MHISNPDFAVIDQLSRLSHDPDPEMSQNAIGMTWTREEIDEKLRVIMRRIHEQCADYGSQNGQIDYFKGANIAGFVKVADVMLAYGIV